MLKTKFWNRPKIFISYRREDSGGYAGRLYADLVKSFGKRNVFMDIDTIQGGDDFIKVLEQTLNLCDVLIAVLGKNWLTIKDAKTGARRLDDPEDFVRRELATALKRNIVVVPVLVQGTMMPQKVNLPEDIKSLADRQTVDISDNRWQYDVKKLVSRLERVKPAKESFFEQVTTWRKIGLAIGAAVVLLLGMWAAKQLLMPNDGETIKTGKTAGACLVESQKALVNGAVQICHLASEDAGYCYYDCYINEKR